MTRGTAVVRNAIKLSFSIAWDIVCFLAKFSSASLIKRAKSAAQNHLTLCVLFDKSAFAANHYICLVCGLAGQCQKSSLKLSAYSQFAGPSPWIVNTFWPFSLPVDLPKTRWIADLIELRVCNFVNHELYSREARRKPSLYSPAWCSFSEFSLQSVSSNFHPSP